jgi:hypothetical protein
MANAEAEAIRQKVLQLIEAGKRAGFQQAVANLQHYLNGKGQRRIMPASVFQSQPFLIQHLVQKHYPQFRAGLVRRVKSKELRPGMTIPLTWKDSIVAPYNTDLFFALGGFSVLSEVQVYAFAVAGDPAKGLICRFQKWIVTYSDNYNWDTGKATAIPGFGVVKDEDIRKLERAGMAKSFLIVSQPVDMLPTMSKQSSIFAFGNPEMAIDAS